MIRLLFTDNSNLYAKVRRALEGFYGCKEPIEIDFSHAKPRLVGAYAGVYDFNVTHSGDRAAIALSDSLVGVDMELIRGKNHPSVLSRFSAQERSEISCEEHFLKNWTAKEAFIKMNGYTLATHLKRLQFYGGKMRMDGEIVPCAITFIAADDCMVAVCGKDEEIYTENI